MKNIFRFRIVFAIAAIALLSAGCVNKANAPLSNDNNNNQQTNAQVNAASFSVKYQGAEGKTALELLKQGHSVGMKSFAGMGDFVNTIDGVTPDSSHFFAFYVNGKISDVGADQYKTKNGDQIEWKLEEIKQ